MKGFLVSLACCCLVGIIQGQEQNSLWLKEGLSPLDTASVSRLIAIGRTHEASEPELAGAYYLAAGQLSERLGHELGTLKYISNYTYILNMRGQYDSSLLLNTRAVELAHRLKDSLALAKSLFNTGTSYQLMGRYELAAQHYLEGRRIFESLGFENYNVIGSDILQTLYQKLYRYQEAMTYGQQAISAARTLQMQPQLGIALSNMAVNYIALSRYNEALEVLGEALSISQQLRDKYLEESIHINFSRTYEALNRYQPMLQHAEMAHQLAREISDASGIGQSLLLFSAHALFTGDIARARTLAEEALLLFSENDLPADKATALRWLSEVCLADKDISAFQQYRTEEANLRNSLLDQQLQDRILGLEQKYQSEIREQRIALLESNELRQNRMLSNRHNWVLVLTALVLLLSVVIFLVFRNLRHKLQLRQKALHRVALEAQLTATESLLKGEEQERERVARDLHDSLGALLSGIKYSFQNMKGNMDIPQKNEAAYNEGLSMLDASIDEIRRIAHNMMPANLLKFGLDTALKDFCTHLNMEGTMQLSYQSVGLNERQIGQSRMLSLYRIVQELLTNALRHSAASNIIVQLIQADDRLSLTVEDDGKGFDTSTLEVAKGMGWENVKNRVSLLKADIDVQSGPGKGTTVEITLEL